MADVVGWSRAYARQARADFETFLRIREDQLPFCHQLLFLQMASEKTVKAYLCRQGTDPHSLQKSHAYVALTLPIVLQQVMTALGFSPAKTRGFFPFLKRLSHEIELLAPSVKRDGKRPDNCEYPWEDALGSLHIPLNWSFPSIQQIAQPRGLEFLKLLQAAILRSL